MIHSSGLIGGRARRRFTTAAAISGVVALLAVAEGVRLLPAQAAPAAAGYSTGKLLAADSFSRTIPSGLGAAEVGGPYATRLETANILNVRDGKLRMGAVQRGKSAQALVSSVSASDVEMRSTLTIPSISSARIGLYDSFVLRRQANNDRYYAKVNVNANGSVRLGANRTKGWVENPSLGTARSKAVLKSGSELVVQARIVGTDSVNILMRAWIKGTPVPDWELNVTDKGAGVIKSAGSVGYMTYESTTGTPTPLTRDDLVVKQLVQPATAPPVAPTSTTSTTSPPTTSTTLAPPASTTSTTSTTALQPAPLPQPGDDADSKFTLAVMPDTQQEVLNSSDPRFKNRTTWLANNKTALDLAFVTHSGDVMNWDTPDHSQFKVGSNAMAVLEGANIPYSLAVGNHDTNAVCPGGSACPGASASVEVRNTNTFNSFFTADRFGAVAGQYQPNKVDNSYSLFEKEDLKWMVLTLELWPRPEVVTWAKQVVAQHPNYNVIVVTHDYLDPSGNIEQTNGGYGATSPQYLYDNLIKQYANIRMVFSGHVGSVAYRTDTGVNGNKVYSLLQCIHDNKTNPVRLVEIDTKANSINTRVYSPYTNQSYPSWDRQITGINWVR